jgi:metallopeptidase MepB
MAEMIPPQLPLLFDATPSQILEETTALVDKRSTLWDAICRDVIPEIVAIDNFLTPILQNDNHWIARSQALGFYASTSPSKDLRDASKTATDILDRAEIDLYLRDGIYSLFDALISRHDTGKLQLEPENLRFSQKMRLKFEKHGCSLPDGHLTESFRAATKQLKEYERQFQSNLNDDKKGIWMT